MKIFNVNFFLTENLCRPMTFYKIFSLRNIFLSGNEPLVRCSKGQWLMMFLWNLLTCIDLWYNAEIGFSRFLTVIVRKVCYTNLWGWNELVKLNSMSNLDPSIVHSEMTVSGHLLKCIHRGSAWLGKLMYRVIYSIFLLISYFALYYTAISIAR